MKDKIIEILSKHMEDYQDGEFFHYALIANEILALFEKEQEYYKSFFGHIRKKGDCTAMEDYSERIDYVGIDPVKWGEVEYYHSPRTFVEFWKMLHGEELEGRMLERANKYFEDNEGIVDTEIIK